jgi:hypothetical protein
MFSRKFVCQNNKDKFCYICANYEISSKNLVDIPSRIFKLYKVFFNLSINDHQKDYAPSKVCRKCIYMLDTAVKTPSKLKFNIPAIWREPASHPAHCYFCSTKTTGMTKSSKSTIKYPENLESAIRPRLEASFVALTQLQVAYEMNELSFPFEYDQPEEMQNESTDESDFENEYESDEQDDVMRDEKYTTAEFNDLVRNQSLSKNQALMLGQIFNSKHNFHRDATFYHMKTRDIEFRRFFHNDDTSIYCADIEYVNNN